VTFVTGNDELVNGWWDDALSDVNTNVTSFAFKVQHFGVFHFESSTFQSV
jgi:hypothetical protein